MLREHLTTFSQDSRKRQGNNSLFVSWLSWNWCHFFIWWSQNKWKLPFFFFFLMIYEIYLWHWGTWITETKCCTVWLFIKYMCAADLYDLQHWNLTLISQKHRSDQRASSKTGGPNTEHLSFKMTVLSALTMIFGPLFLIYLTLRCEKVCFQEACDRDDKTGAFSWF